MKVYLKQRKYDFFGLTITLNRLNKEKQKQLSSFVMKMVEGDIDSVFEAGFFAIKHCISDIKGLVNEDGEVFNLEKDKDGTLTDETVEILTTLPVNQELVSLAYQTSSQTPNEILDKDKKPIKEIKLKN